MAKTNRVACRESTMYVRGVFVIDPMGVFWLPRVTKLSQWFFREFPDVQRVNQSGTLTKTFPSVTRRTILRNYPAALDLQSSDGPAGTQWKLGAALRAGPR